MSMWGWQERRIGALSAKGCASVPIPLDRRRVLVCATPFPPPPYQGLAMPREDLAEWLAFLRSKHFVGHSCPEDLAEACALLERAGRAFLGAALDVDATSGAAAARRPDGGDDDEAGAGRRLQATAPGWPATPAPQTPAPISTNTSPRPAPGGPGATPPDPTPLADGTYTWIGKLGPHGWVALPSDYAAVLAACAAHVWCTPLTMHRVRKGRHSVRGVEERRTRPGVRVWISQRAGDRPPLGPGLLEHWVPAPTCSSCQHHPSRPPPDGAGGGLGDGEDGGEGGV